MSAQSCPLISIVMAAYNAEATIESAIISVINQSCDDIEIVIINDGSRDATEKIVLTLSERFPGLIRLFSQQNKGVSAARNLGKRLALGQWVTFMDADDVLLPNAIEKMKSLISSNSTVDAIFASFIRIMDGHHQECRLSNEEYVFDSKSNMRDLFSHLFGVNLNPSILGKVGISGFLCGTLYRTASENWKELAFDEGVPVMEDMLFKARAVAVSERVVVSPKLLYGYIIRNDSVSHSWSRDRENGIIRTFGVAEGVFESMLPLDRIILLVCWANIIHELFSRRFKYIPITNKIDSSELINNPTVKRAINEITASWESLASKLPRSRRLFVWLICHKRLFLARLLMRMKAKNEAILIN